MEAFTNLNKETNKKVCWSFQSHVEAMTKVNDDFFASI